jgi:hypothetical protein
VSRDYLSRKFSFREHIFAVKVSRIGFVYASAMGYWQGARQGVLRSGLAARDCMGCKR